MAQNPFKFGSIDYDNWNYEHPQDRAQQVDPVWQERNTAPDEFDAINAQRDAAIADIKKKSPGALRGLTETAAGFGQGLGLAALPGIVPSPYTPIAGVLGTAGSMAMAPDYVRRMIPALREAGEESPGLLETAATIGPAAIKGGGAVLRGLRSLVSFAPKGAEIASDAANLLGGRALAYEGAQAPARAAGVVDPLQRMAQASRTTPVEQLMEMPSFRNLPKGNVSKAKSAQVFNDAPKTPSVFQRMKDEGAFQGDRTTGQFEEGPGGLSSLAGLSRGKTVPSGTANSILNDMEGSYGHGLRPSTRKPWQEIALPDAEPQIPEMDRLAARSAERFGRRFRKE